MEHNIKGPHTRGYSPSVIYGRESCGFDREDETPDFIPEGHIVLDGKSPAEHFRRRPRNRWHPRQQGSAQPSF
jgi:hypothetical protein